MTQVSYSATELKALTEAGLALTSELSLPALLQKLVETTREQVNAKYGALSVLGKDGMIAQFLTSGISAAQRRKIGDPPRGHGLLGVLLREGASLRMPDLGEDPRSLGFPANHPPMRSLLGVPVISHGRIIGNLYLAEKRGAQEFSAADEEIVRLLATQAAVAIHNAELYEAEQRRAEEWKALFELGREVGASPELQQILDSVVTRTRALLGTDVAALMLLRGRDTLAMAAHDGLRTPGMKSLSMPAEHGLQGLALREMRPVIVGDYESDPRLHHRPGQLVSEEGLVSQICTPLKGKRTPLGTLTVGNRTPTTFEPRQAELLEAFANWTAVAIETSRLYEQLSSLARLEERERIGMDLHDGVIQSIYAVGLRLEDISDRLPNADGDIKTDLDRAMSDLSAVIKDIRSYIFDLRPRVSQVADLPQAIRQLSEDLRLNTLMAVAVDIEEPLTGQLDETEAMALFHITQEALNNISKHSRAAKVELHLQTDGRAVHLDITDDGVGFKAGDDSGGGQGLRNMKDRANSVGASITCDSTPGRGTRISVELPTGAGKEPQ